MLNKKAQGMHMWGGTDLFIILGGILAGIAIVYFGIQGGWMPQSMFCPAPLVVP